MPSFTTVITTTHDRDGKSVFRASPALKPFNDRISIIYSTSSSKALDLVDAKDIFEHETRDLAALIPKEGSVVLMAEWAPSTDSRLHRTQSIDIGVMIAGEKPQYDANSTHDLFRFTIETHFS
ncbi:cupin domain containing protein [Pyrenophora tritici-repentis Pt-1C-BFP]|uniref:Cupin domain containing protein n=1 Tax=Pyrenophora tritici-repentis (strain Pt-1C-BFP) TaxID=426418 RepID=B2WPB6_PYRTR|nr:cupin domain containing protein [Pyrenophora tritici-repentis Pt-1C-BFP]EDU45982.1 cupin domain containing protein [Pyrenophora tritici-repentis Pt-1C-BFP]